MESTHLGRFLHNQVLDQPEIAHIVGRDPERTPMQWDASQNAGFSAQDTRELWLPLAPNYMEVNVARQLEDPRSMLNLYRKLIAYRKASPASMWDSYLSVDAQNENCFVFERQSGDQRFLVALNFSDQEQKLRLPELSTGRMALSTDLDRQGAVDLVDFSLSGAPSPTLTISREIRQGVEQESL